MGRGPSWCPQPQHGGAGLGGPYPMLEGVWATGRPAPRHPSISPVQLEAPCDGGMGPEVSGVLVTFS